MISRRRALQLACSAATLGVTAGCLGVLRDGGVRVRLDNRDSRQHTVGVTFEADDETVFEDQFSVPAGEETTTADVVDAGAYLVTVELDSSETRTVDFSMAGCPSNTLFVGIDDGGAFEASVLDEC